MDRNKKGTEEGNKCTGRAENGRGTGKNDDKRGTKRKGQEELGTYLVLTLLQQHDSNHVDVDSVANTRVVVHTRHLQETQHNILNTRKVFLRWSNRLEP